jgi:hypothetical protein
VREQCADVVDTMHSTIIINIYISLCELSLWNAAIPIETWNLISSSIWPNLTMMDITRVYDNQGKRPLEWMQLQ